MRKQIIIATFLAIFVLITAGTVSAADEQNSASDIQAPTVTSVDPTDNSSNVSEKKTIAVTFNENIKAGSDYNNIAIIKPDGNGKAINKIISGNKLTITPVYDWNPGEKYTIYIPKNAITDLAGNNLTTSYTSTFTTDYGPAVSSVDPSNGTINVSCQKEIKITFAEPIQAGSSYNSIAVIKPDGNGKTISKIISGNQLIITAVYGWNQETKFTLVLPINSLMDMDGNGIAAYNSIFTTNSDPFITEVDPTKNAVNVNDSKVIKVTFNEQIKAGSAYNSISVLKPNGVGKTITKTIKGNVLYLTALYGWNSGETDTIYIPKNAITDLAGNNLTSSYTSAFTTDYGPVVFSVDPADGSNQVPENQVITITFGENIKAGSNFNSIAVIKPDGNGKTISKTINGNQLIITTPYTWNKDSKFTILIPANAIADMDSNGNAVVFASTFDTDTNPYVTNCNPANGVTDVSDNKQIIITFNENIAAGSNFNSIAVIKPDGNGKTISKTINGNQLIITAAYGWNPGETDTIYIPKNAIVDATGNKMNSDYNSTFTTDFGPAITDVNPANGATGVPVTQVITITFDSSIQAGSDYSHIAILKPDGVGKTISKTINGNQLIITVTYDLEPETTYTIYIPKFALSDLDGDSIAYSYTSTFTTATT